MEVPETHYAKTVDGFHIAYQTLGAGPTDLVPVAPYFSNLEHLWTEPGVASFRRSLAELGRLIMFDARGTGLSDPVEGDLLPTLEERIDDLRAVMDAVDSERVVLVAFADSGPLGCLFAATYPGRTKGLILQNGGSRIAWAPDYPWGMTREEFQAELDNTETRWGTREYAAEIVRETYLDRANDDTLVDWWARFMRQSASPSAAATLLRMYYNMDVRQVLPSIHVPTLVIASDPAAEESKAMARQIPGALFTRIQSPAPVAMADPEPFLAEIRRFVARIGEEVSDLDRVLATVLFTDIVDSTAQSAALGDRVWHDLRQQHDHIVRANLARYRGREIKTMGDGFLATFDGPARGVRCAQDIVGDLSPLGLEIRAGLHTGEVTLDGDDVAGIGVAIGARVGALAGPSEVLVSSTVKDLVVGSGLTFTDAGEHELKGVPDRWRLYRVADLTT